MTHFKNISLATTLSVQNFGVYKNLAIGKYQIFWHGF